jgi:hypothetical protein
MDWSNEDYVRMYTRETADDLELSWEALALWRAMLCKFDRSGVIPVRNGWPSIARMVRMPVDVVERAGTELVTDGRVRVTKHGFVAPNFTEAQTASKSDKARQQESRDRRRAAAMVKVHEITSAGHTASHGVTKRDAESQNVTLTSALLAVAEAPVTSLPLKSPPAAGTPKVKLLPSAEALSAAARLMARIIANSPNSTQAKVSEAKRQATVIKWADVMRLLHDIDGHSWTDIDDLIDWCQDDPFWKSNILSGAALREKWDQLLARKNNPLPAARSGGGPQLDHLRRMAGEP